MTDSELLISPQTDTNSISRWRKVLDSDEASPHFKVPFSKGKRERECSPRLNLLKLRVAPINSTVCIRLQKK